jgi:hypothetical protein
MMHTPMDIAVPRAVRFHNRINHLLGLLARRRIIQVHQIPSVYLLFQYRKIFSIHGL